MRESIFAVLVILMVGLVATQAGTEGSFKPEESPSDSTSAATCGDGVCKSVEKGVCPQDCQEDYVPPNDTGTQQDTNTSSSENANNTETGKIGKMIPGKTVLYSLIVVGLVLTAAALGLEKMMGDEEDELADWVKRQLEDGYNSGEIREFLQQEGYEDEKIHDAIQQARKDL